MKTVDEIKRHLRKGDYEKVGKLAGVSRDYVHKLLNRPTAKKHQAVLKAAQRVANFNKKLGL